MEVVEASEGLALAKLDRPFNVQLFNVAAALVVTIHELVSLSFKFFDILFLKASLFSLL